MLATAEQLPRTRGGALWAAEVTWLISAAPGLRPNVRAAVLGVVRSLSADSAFPPEERADLLTLLDALEPATPM